ncbi:HlyD family efflux transporter periplasmic adaptor subunit [Romboutsia sp.]|uniref:HlyD family efflux transporter periplasmic adaptor subunit n=1 Tax=Romboutsia sp. TaxID=1965302 RepID=UPI003F4177B0
MKRVKYSNFLILGVFIYIIFQLILMLISKSTSTLVLEKENIEEKITTKGLFVREEYLIKSDVSGTLVLDIKNGEKVKQGQIIGKVYKDEDGENTNKKQIEALATEIKGLEKQKEVEISSIISTQIKTKQDQIKLLKNKNEKNTTYVNALSSGIVCYKYDGNEELYNLERLNSLNEEDIKNASNYYKNVIDNERNIKKNQIVARIVNNNESYVAICVNHKEANKFDVNKNIKIRLNQNEVETVVKNVYQNKDYDVVILKITNQNVEIYDTRVKEFDIIYTQAEGLKIPKSCVKEIDNKQGVYVVNQQTKKIEFVELKSIQYENKDYIFIDDYKNDIEGIKTVRVNDELILKPNSINTNIRIK